MMRYASQIGVDIINMSWSSAITSYDPGIDGEESKYWHAIDLMKLVFADGLDPHILYVNAAGNVTFDLDKSYLWPSPDPDHRGVWYFPIHVVSDYKLVITSTNMNDEFAALWFAKEPPDDLPGANFGATVVDFAAPGDYIRVLRPGNQSSPTFGTSLSAPIVAGVAGLAISRYPTRFKRQPLKTIQRLHQTLDMADPLDPNNPLNSLMGKVATPGRVSIPRLLDHGTYPLPEFNPYENESWRLNDLATQNTLDVHFVDKESDGQVDLMVKVYGGLFPDREMPRLFEYDGTSQTFRDVTYGVGGWPGGTGDQLDRLEYTLERPGNFSKVASGDFDGDGCLDLVLAGFVEADLGNPPDGLRGTGNHLLLQVKTGTECTGRFTDTHVPQFALTTGVTRDIDVFDVNGDSLPDILFTGHSYAYVPGGDIGDQLLLRNGGVVDFVDETQNRGLADPGVADPMSSLLCDVDDDGDLDIVQAMAGWNNRLYINDGTGHFVDETVARLPTSIGIHTDVKCFDWLMPDGTMGQDGSPELIFALRRPVTASDTSRQNKLFLNNGVGVFSDASHVLPPVEDTTRTVELCDLDGDGIAEILFGNGGGDPGTLFGPVDMSREAPESNRVLQWEPGTGLFVDRASQFGFDFERFPDFTTDIQCVNLDGDPNNTVDVVVIANTGGRDWLYFRHW